MDIIITIRHGSISEAAKARITEKIERLSKFMQRISKTEIVIDLEKPDMPKIDLMMITEMKKEFNASYTSNDMFGAIDQVIDKIQQQMKKFNEKITNLQR